LLADQLEVSEESRLTSGQNLTFEVCNTLLALKQPDRSGRLTVHC